MNEFDITFSRENSKRNVDLKRINMLKEKLERTKKIREYSWNKHVYNLSGELIKIIRKESRKKWIIIKNFHGMFGVTIQRKVFIEDNRAYRGIIKALKRADRRRNRHEGKISNIEGAEIYSLDLWWEEEPYWMDDRNFWPEDEFMFYDDWQRYETPEGRRQAKEDEENSQFFEPWDDWHGDYDFDEDFDPRYEEDFDPVVIMI